MQGYCDVYKWTILKRTSPEVKCLHPTSSRREMCTSSVSNVIYHKFSHGAAFYTLNGKNVNVILESYILVRTHSIYTSIQMKCQGGVIFVHAPRLIYCPKRRIGYARCSLTGSKIYPAITKLTNTM